MALSGISVRSVFGRFCNIKVTIPYHKPLFSSGVKEEKTIFSPKETVYLWDSSNNKTLQFKHEATSATAKWVKRDNRTDVEDVKVVTVVADGVATGKNFIR